MTKAHRRLRYIPSLKVHLAWNVRLCVTRVSHGVSAACCRLGDDGPDTGDLPDDLETRMVTALRSMKTDLVDAAMEGYCSCCL